MSERIFQHLNPVWKEQADFIIGAHVPLLENKPEEKAWEQLWAKRINNDHYKICCIPLFSYGYALGDEVKIDQNFMIIKVTKKSGYETLRIWFHESVVERIRDEILEIITNNQCLFEWYSHNLLGVSVDTPTRTDGLVKLLEDFQSNGMINIELANR